MKLQFSGTHFLNDNTFRQILKTERGTVDQYNPDNGAEKLIMDYVGFGPKSNWKSVGELNNVWILDSGSGETEQDKDFTKALQEFADKNGLKCDDFHRFSPKRFNG